MKQRSRDAVDVLPTDAPRAAWPVADALCEILTRQADFIAALDDSHYARPPAGQPSGIGAHVRHTLDHVQALLRGRGRGWVDYDDRARGTDIERDRGAALRLTRRLCRQLAELRGDDRAAIEVRALVCPAGPTVATPSSLARELLFVLSHTVHHQAMMASAAHALGAAAPPPRFGFAPATLAHLEQACAPSAS